MKVGTVDKTEDFLDFVYPVIHSIELNIAVSSDKGNEMKGNVVLNYW